MQPVRAAIALGSNLGDRHAHLAAAFAALAQLPSTRLVAQSPIIDTAPVGPVAQGSYLNAAAVVETRLLPRDLLQRLLAIEHARGRDRTREERWGPRTLDLDLILYADRLIAEPGLEVPHPRLRERLFVLEPLAAIWPDAVVRALPPTPARTIAQLLAELKAARAAGVPSPP